MISAKDEGDRNVSVWKSEGPITVAGFNFGKFKADQSNLDKIGVTVKAYANKEPPDWVKSLQHRNEGDLPSQGAQRAYENMVVVDNARKMIGKTVDISVTSVLQTTAGKMIFGKWDERVTGTTRSEPPRVPSTPPSPPITPSSAPEVRKVPLVE